MAFNKVLPDLKDKKFKVDSYNQDGSQMPNEENFSQPLKKAFEKDGFGKASLMLFRVDKNGLNANPIHVLPLNDMQRARIEFSQSGDKLLLYYRPLRHDNLNNSRLNTSINKEKGEDAATEELMIYEMPTEKS
jgi:hypothetical protein